MDQVTEGSSLNTNKLEISTGHHIQSLYLGTITATAPSLLPLVFLPALSGFFIFRVAGITLDALLVNQPDGPEPFTDYR
ncbi:hypothetical protein ACUN59_000424 [Klebsiella variicola]